MSVDTATELPTRSLAAAARRSRTIGLLDHMGGGNLGDDATQTAVMQNIRARWPHAAIVGFSLNPADTHRRHGIPSYAIRTKTWQLGADRPAARRPETPVTLKERVKRRIARHGVLFGLLRALNAAVIRMPKAVVREVVFLARSFRRLRTLDVLIVSGGGQLTEWGGPWTFPYTIFKWAVLARLAGVERVFLNVGAGPLTRPLSRYFVRRALELADYASFRDEQSRRLVHRIGFQGRSHVFPDNVYGLQLPASNGHGVSRRVRRLVGIAPMPYCDPRVYPEKDQAVYERLIRELARFGAWLTRRSYDVTLFGSDIGVDPLAIDDLERALRDGHDVDPSARVRRVEATCTEELLAEMASMDYVVTCRFHGVVFAHLLNTPVLAISHHPKVATLMNALGLARYCVDIRRLDLPLLSGTFESLVDRRDEVRRRLAEALASYRSELTRQFDHLFPAEAP